MSTILGNSCRAIRITTAAAVVGLLLSLASLTAGCNFFGKETPATPPPPGQLSNGLSVVGTWSMDLVDVSTADVPTAAETVTYTFTGAGAATVEYRNQLSGGGTCTGDGPYVIDNSGNVDIVIQAVNNADCEFPATITLQNPSVGPVSLSFIDPTTGDSDVAFADLGPPLQLVGVWDFGGQGGIDFLFFDQHGYFLMGTTENGQSGFLQGYYTLSSGTLTLSFFNSDPTEVEGTTEFSSYSNNGQQLVLTQTSTQGTSTYTGTLQ